MQQYGNISDREQARTAAGVTLSLLADRVDMGQARDLSPALPEGMRTYLATHKKTAQSFDKATMLDWVVTATGAADQNTAEAYVRAVFATLTEWVSHRQLADTCAQLPPGIAAMFDQQPGNHQ